MPNILTHAESEAEYSVAGSVVDIDAGATRAPYGQLSPEDFELLLYAIFKSQSSDSSYFDAATLMNTGADRGRDVWLTRNERPAGLVQCKRLSGAFSAPDAIREVIKFLLFVV